MNNIPGVSYPINPSVKEQICKRENLARRLKLPQSNRSNLEVMRFLDNTHYKCCAFFLDYLDDSIPIAEWLVDEILKETDMMQFEARLAELYMLRHIAEKMPSRVIKPDGLQSEKKPDMIVKHDMLDVAVEVYSPTDVFGFQLVKTYVCQVLKYLDVDLGYGVRVKIEPSVECYSAEGEPGYNSSFFAYNFEKENDIRNWLADFASEVTEWLSHPQPQPPFRKNGPSEESSWKVTVEIEELHQNRDCRYINTIVAGQSNDARLYFETCSLDQANVPAELPLHSKTCPKHCAKTTVEGWWGCSVKRKMEKRQAGPEPRDGLLRLLVVDFSRLDTSFPDFICWPKLAARIDESIRQIANEIKQQNDVLPYDMVLPARLRTACCFGSPIWLKNRTDIDMNFVSQADLIVPCKKPQDITDWSSLLAE